MNSPFIDMNIVLIATISSPIIAVIIAIWTSKSSAKATAKQIMALKESTSRQMESIKQLAKIQIETTSLILEKELRDAKNLNQQTIQKSLDSANNLFDMMGMSSNDLVARMHDKEEKRRSLDYQQEFYDKQIEFLNSCLKRLEKIKNDLAIS